MMKFSKSCFVSVFLAAIVGSSACISKDNSTQITVALASETEIPTELDTVQVVVIDAKGSEIYRNEYPVTYPRFFPTTLAIVPRDDDSLDRPVTIEVRGFKSTSREGQVFRRAVVPFFKGRTLLVPMPLRMACFNFADCKENETCAGGRCVPAQIEASKLVDFREELVFGGLPNAACFDETSCLGDGKPVTVNADCTFPIPASSVGPDGAPQVNVSIRWAAADGRVIGLDGDDPVEGWTRVDARTGRLSPGVCDSLLDPEPNPKLRRVPDRALDARVSAACPTKTHDHPPCPSGDGHSGAGVPIRP
jgi:hypothetical protein